MAGMPDPIEYSTSGDSAGQIFAVIEKWLNDPDPATRQSRRSQAAPKVAAFGGITAPTLEGNDANNALPHFNQHWRAGTSGWWPNVSRARVNAQMSAAFSDAFAPGNYGCDIRLRWDCRPLDLNTPNAFWADATVSDGVVWIDILSPRAPGGLRVVDLVSQLPNYGFHAVSDLEPKSFGPFTALGDREVANYDGSSGVDTSFDFARGELITTEGFRESWSFFPITDPIENGSQVLTGLSYRRDSWRPASDRAGAFEETLLHSETGYLLWDAANGLAYRTVAMPRGVTVLAVARDVEADSADLTFEAVAGASDPLLGGILSNPLLSASVQTVHFSSSMRIADDSSSFSYDDTVQQLRVGDDRAVAHTDSNSLTRI